MAILNADGTPMKKSGVLTSEIAAPTVTGVRQIMSGHPAQGLNPNRLARLLRSAEQGDAIAYFELAEEMEEKDLHYLGVIGTRKRAVTGLDVEVVAADETAEAERHADFIRDILDRDELEDELFDIMDAVGKGVSFTEIIWEKTSGAWYPAKFEWRDPRWFQFDPKDGKTPLIRNGATGDPLPKYKFIQHRVRAKSGLPIRSGLARAIAWCYMFKNFAVKDWVVFAEVYGQPFRIGKFHSSATEEDKEILARAVSMIGTDAAVIIPNSMLIEFVKDSNQAASADVFQKLADFMDQQISKAILGQTTTTDAIGGGHAVSKEHQEVRIDIQQADAKQLQASLNRDLVVPAIDLNFGPQKKYPKIKLPIPEGLDLQAFSTSIKTAAEAGVKIPSKFVRDKMGIPDPQTDDEVIGGIPQILKTKDASEPKAQTSARHSDDDKIDQLVSDIIESDGFEMVKPMLQPVLELAASSKNYEEFQESLEELIYTMNTEKFVKELSEAMFSANIAGQLEIPKSDD